MSLRFGVFSYERPPRDRMSDLANLTPYSYPARVPFIDAPSECVDRCHMGWELR